MTISAKDSQTIVVGNLTDQELESVATLLTSVFPKAKHFSVEYLRWQYKENPDGEAVTLNAYHGEELIAHYAVIPILMNLDGQKTLGCLSLNTAVAPKAHGRGLFTRLASQCYKTAFEKGYKFIIGVANANSTPGFVNNLDFQLVKSLDAFFFYGNVPHLLSDKGKIFCRDWNDATLMWRLNRPFTSYRISGGSGDKLVYSASQLSGIDVCCLQVSQERIYSLHNEKELNLPQRNLLRPKIWIGVSPKAHKFSFKIPIPKLLRPSPLNLIFKDLTGRNIEINPERVQFEVLDFDAY